MEHRKQVTNEIERRYTTGNVEFKGVDNGIGVIRGYALKFGVSYNMGWFTEEVDRRALENADISDVRVLQDHVSHLILGRTKAGTASVGIDDVGLWYEVNLPDSPNGHNVRVAVSRGDVDQSSWGFMLRVSKDGNGDRWERRDGKEHRILTDVATVFDTSPVTFAANPDTSVAKRSFDILQQSETEKTRQQIETENTETEIDLALLERHRFSPKHK